MMDSVITMPRWLSHSWFMIHLLHNIFKLFAAIKYPQLQFHQIMLTRIDRQNDREGYVQASSK